MRSGFRTGGGPFFKKALDSARAYAGLVVPAKRFMFPEYKFAANYYWPEKKAAAAPAAAPAPAKPAAPAKKPWGTWPVPPRSRHGGG